MMRAVILFVATVSASVVSAQSAPPPLTPMPPPPPRPQGGSIVCDLKDATGLALTLRGELGWSELRDGKRYPEAQFESNDPGSEGRYQVKWLTSGAEFAILNSETRMFSKIVLLATTYGSGPGAAVMETWSTMGGNTIYRVGFCQTQFTQTGRYFG